MAKVVVEEMKRWPKVELHCHLEGTVHLETAWKWAQYSPWIADITFEGLQRKIQFDGIRNYAHFLNKFGTLRLLYYHPEAIKEVVRKAVATAAADNVRYLELRFSPDHFARQAGHDPYEVAQLILRTGMEEADKQGIMVRFLCTIGRAYDLETSKRTLDIALTFRSMGIVGLDLAGNELKHPHFKYKELFEVAASEGLGISIHAGEAGPAARVWEAVLELNADRIAHGIRSIDDPTLLAFLSEQNIACEVCPTSNLHTGVVDSPAEHPLAALVKAGVPVALSSDDPAMSRISLSDEYRFAIEEAGLERPTLANMVLTAANHAFLPPAEKEELLRNLQQELSELTGANAR
ncbi:MAG: adenosine deaminase [Ardenticatenaceae bacterium]